MKIFETEKYIIFFDKIRYCQKLDGGRIGVVFGNECNIFDLVLEGNDAKAFNNFKASIVYENLPITQR